METSHKFFKVHTNLILFAADFSKNYRRLDIGNYFDNEKRYGITFNTNKFFEAPPTNVWRVEHLTNAMQVSHEWIHDPEISADFVFFMIIWSACLIHYKKELNVTDFARADREAIAYYLTTGRNFNNVVRGYVFIFKKWAPNDEKNRRLGYLLATQEALEQKGKPRTETSYLIDNENKTVTVYPLHLLSKIYSLFLDGEIRPNQIKIAHLSSKVRSSLQKIYLRKGFKVYFSFKKDLIELL